MFVKYHKRTAGFSILNLVYWQSWKMYLKMGYFVDILIYPRVINVFICINKLSKKFERSAPYVVFYAFEDSKTLIVFILGRK